MTNAVTLLERKTIATSTCKAAPWRVLLYTFPLWGMSALLMLFMPLTGIITSILVAMCLFILPFKAKYGLCPDCGQGKLFPFSGFGSACKGCGKELVLRGELIHLLEQKRRVRKVGAGRG